MSAETFGNVALVVVWFGAVLSVAVYARVPWWRSAMGQHLFFYMGVVALTLTLGVIRIVWEPWWFWWLRLGAFALFGVGTYWRLVLLVKAQVDTWRDQRDAAAGVAGEGAVGVPRQGGQDRGRHAAGSGNGA